MADPAFDGATKRIIMPSAAPADVVDIYSAWKRWVLDNDANSAWEPAFRVIGGDPIGPGLTVAPYFFLNTPAGWRIRPYESTHELRLTGNLYSEDPNLSLFAATLGAYTVTTVVERSASAQTVSVGSGLSPSEQQKLTEIYQILGLDSNAPAKLHPDYQKVPEDGSVIDIVATHSGGATTLTRQ